MSIEQFNYVKTVQRQSRFHHYIAQRIHTNELVEIYHFEAKEDINVKQLLNDFYVTVQLLRKVSPVQVIDVVVVANSYYIVFQHDDKTKSLTTWLQTYTAQHERLKLWLKIIQQVATVHTHNIAHGHLVLSTISIAQDESIVIQETLLWRFYQLFGIIDPTSTSGRSYRLQQDDFIQLGEMLWSMIYPQYEYPTSELDLQLIDMDQLLYKLFYYLLFQREVVSFATLLEVAQAYEQQLIGNVTIYIQWDKRFAHYFYRHEVELIDWEQQFLNDVQLECYVYTTYDKQRNELFIKAIGLQYAWTLYVTTLQDNIMGDVVLFDVNSLSTIEREKLKSRGERYLGRWLFKAYPIQKRSDYIEQLRLKTRQNVTLWQERKQSRAVLDEWNEVLTEQQALLHQNNGHFYYAGYSLFSAGRVVFEIDDAIPNFTRETEIATMYKDAEIILGIVVEQGTGTLSLQISQGVDVTILEQQGVLYEYTKRKAILLRRQQKVLSDFMYGRLAYPHIREAVIKPERITTEKRNSITPLQDLNSDQTSALQQALATQSLFLLQGPPGTGKTTWITELIYQIYKENPYARVLIASQSNVAVDHAFEKVQLLLASNDADIHMKPYTVRLGIREKMSPFSETLHLPVIVEKWSEQALAQSFENISAIAQQRMLQDPTSYMQLMTLFEQWRDTLQRTDDLELVYVQQKPLLAGATCMASYQFQTWKQQFDWVIIDEAAKATVPETLIPLSLGQKVVLVGDHKQLAPLVVLEEQATTMTKEKQQQLEKSLFEELFEETPHKAALQTQYRMHPTIAEVVSQLFYKEKLTTGKRKHRQIIGEATLNWLATDSHLQQLEQSYKRSYYNEAEIMLLIAHIEKLYTRTTEPMSVAIITGYAAQREKLRRAISDLQLPRFSIEIDTVDAFQGKEADIVYYSLVRHNTKSQFGFLADERRTNVMLSRAKEHVYIVGHFAQINNLAPTHVLHKLQQAFEKKGFNYIPWQEVLTC